MVQQKCIDSKIAQRVHDLQHKTIRQTLIILIKRLNSLVLNATLILWLAAVLDPHGKILGFRFIALAIALFVSAFAVISHGVKINKQMQNYWVICIFFSVLLPVYGLSVATFRGGFSGQDFIDTSYIAAGVLFLTSVMYLYATDPEKLIKRIIFALRVLAYLIFIVQIFSATQIFEDFVWFWVSNEVAAIGRREYAGIEFPYIYFYASPMLFTLLVYSGWNVLSRPSPNNVLDLFVTLTALILSGTRANILLSFFALFLVVMWKAKDSKTARIMVVVFIACYTIGFVYLYDLIAAFFSSSDESNLSKIQYLITYAGIFNDPIDLIFGQGFNAHVWSNSASNIIAEDASKTELTYLEFVRVFGVIVFLMFILTIVMIILKLNSLSSQWRWLSPSLAMLILVANLNPYLFSTNGMLLLGLCAAFLTKVDLRLKAKII